MDLIGWLEPDGFEWWKIVRFLFTDRHKLHEEVAIVANYIVKIIVISLCIMEKQSEINQTE